VDPVTPSTPPITVAKDHYGPASQFLSHFLSLLFLQSENLEAPIIRQVKESCSFELSPLLYESVFEQIKTFTERFFDSSGEILLTYGNTQFIEHAVYIMKNILLEIGSTWKSDLKISCIEPILLTFCRYFSLFMNLLNDCSASDSCSGVDSDNISVKGLCSEYARGSFSAGSSTGSKQQGENNTDLLRNATIESMSCLLAANIDTGLIHSVGLGYHKDTRVRLAFVQVLIKILQQGTEFETLNETVMADRYEELIRLVTMITADGEMPVVNALDELAIILVTVSAWRNLLNELLWKLFSQEVKLAEAPTTLFRGNTLASKIMGYCFKLYGASYLRNVLRDFVSHVIIQSNRQCYEVNPSRFPVQLKSTCNILYNVVNARFPNNGLLAVGMILFLRFFNPAIDIYPNHTVKRGLMLVSKVLQQIANQTDFVKDTCLQSFVSNITLESPSCIISSPTVTFVHDATVSSLHRLLWRYQDEIGEYLTSVRSYELISRRLITLLAQMGPAEHKTSETGWNSADLTSNQFEEFMAKQNMTEKEEFKSVKATNVFYQSGYSRNGYPTFYFIAVRYK
ncbi:unnamed protein product, partial [Soboliphyme baturini]|uniref:Ras-GAP domain-containing protein n=1 Tax=Soboliphyme baturini TaxID=241478 RepID=A0A183J1A1_9BILA